MIKLSRRQFIFASTAAPLIGTYLKNPPYLCNEACCVDWAPAALQGNWFEEGRFPTQYATPCQCGYLPGYRVHDCPVWPDSLTGRHNLLDWWAYQGKEYAIYTCNGLPEGYESIQTDAVSREWMYDAILEMQDFSHIHPPTRVMLSLI